MCVCGNTPRDWVGLGCSLDDVGESTEKKHRQKFADIWKPSHVCVLLCPSEMTHASECGYRFFHLYSSLIAVIRVY